MQRELINQWTQLTRNTFDSLRELGEINARLVEQLSRQQLSVLNASIEATTRGTQLASQSGGYGELLDNQTTVAAEYNKKILNIVAATTDVLTEARDELSAWVERGMRNVEQGAKIAGRTVERTVQWGAEQAQEGVDRVSKTAQSTAKSAQNTAKRAAKSANGGKRTGAKQTS